MNCKSYYDLKIARERLEKSNERLKKLNRNFRCYNFMKK